ALETDEEILDANGVGINWLLANHRDLIDAAFALNEGGGVALKAGKPLRNVVQTSEKISLSYELEVKNKGGHSSLPRKDNAIYRLAAGLVRLSEFNFPVKFNETTHAYFERAAGWEGQEAAADIRSVLNPEVMGAIKKITGEMWPGTPVVPFMSAGGTDGSALRNAGIPTYGQTGLSGDMEDVRAHGKDERV